MTKPAEWPTKGQAVNPYETVGFVVLFFVVVIKKKKKKDTNTNTTLQCLTGEAPNKHIYHHLEIT